MAVAAVGGNPDDTGHPCPRCKAKVAVHTTTWGNGYHWMICHDCECRWAGYGYDYVLDTCGGDVGLAKRALAGVGCKPDKRVWFDSVRRKHNQHLDYFRRGWSLSAAMKSRIIHRQPGLDWPLHRPPLWWAATDPEWRYLVGTKFNQDTAGEACMVTPGYDYAYRICGSVRCRPQGPASTYKASAAPGTHGGFLFRNNLISGKPAVLYENPFDAISVRLKYAVDSNQSLPVTAIPKLSDATVDEAVADAPNCNWVVVIDKNDVTYAAPHVMKLASRLAARVLTINGHPYSPAQEFDHVVENAVPWSSALASVVTSEPAWRVRAVLTAVGWPGLAEQIAVGSWSLTLYDQAKALVNPDNNAVEVRRGLWVSDTTRGWVDQRTGSVLAEAVPIVYTITREGRKIWYTGCVRYKDMVVPFRSSRFRKDPVGVVETVLLNAGVANPPPPHPGIVQHMSYMAHYFGRKAQWQ